MPARRLPALIPGLAAVALLFAHTALWRGERELSQLRTPRRYWEDVGIASSAFHRGARAPSPPPIVIGVGPGPELRRAYQRFVSRAAEEAGIRPWQFWRTVPIRPALAVQHLVHRPSDDGGRAALLTFGYRVLGGVSPWLGLWLGALLGAPVLLWLCWELAAAGRGAAGALLALAVACSPYSVEMLSLPYSAVGFYWVGLLALVPVGAATLVAPPPTRTGLWVRALAAGLVLAVATLCRSGTLLLFPAFALVLAIGALRAAPARARAVDAGGRRPAAGLRALAPALANAGVAVALLVLPYAVAREPRHHYAWPGIWEGLGDFDRSKGHTWYDPAAREALRRAGVEVPRWMQGPEFETPETAAVFRGLVLQHVREDPLWYLGILLQRLIATVAQSKLWPRAAVDGASMAPSTSPNEGVIDVYYRLTTTADTLGAGNLRVELPLPLLAAPAWVLLLLWAAGARVPALRSARERLGPGLALLLLLAAAALAQPVLVTTASGLETEAFVLVYGLAAGLALDLALQRRPGTGRLLQDGTRLFQDGTRRVLLADHERTLSEDGHL